MAARPPIQYALTGVVGVLVGAVGGVLLGPVVGLAVGVGIIGTKLGLDRAMDRRGPGGAVLRVRPHSPESQWLTRGAVAVRRFRELASSARRGPIAERCQSIGLQAQTTLEAMQRLAGQASLVSTTMLGVDGYLLRAEDQRLTRSLTAAQDPGLRDDLARSLIALHSQEQISGRLQTTQARLMAKLQASAIELEGLTARLAEVIALSEAVAPGDATQRIDALSSEMDGLRQGLLEAEGVGRQALGPPNDPVTDATTGAASATVSKDHAGPTVTG